MTNKPLLIVYVSWVSSTCIYVAGKRHLFKETSIDGEEDENKLTMTYNTFATGFHCVIITDLTGRKVSKQIFVPRTVRRLILEWMLS